MDYMVNVNHAISVVGYCILDSNYDKSLLINRELLDTIFAVSVGEELVDTFEKVFMPWDTFTKYHTTKEEIVYIHHLNNKFKHYITRINMNMVDWIIFIQCININPQKYQIDKEDNK